MSNILLPLLAGQWPQGYCPATNQDWLVTIADNIKAVLPAGNSWYNFGDTQPAPEYQGYPWLYSVDMRWYYFNGKWISPNLADANERRIYVGALTGGAGTLEEYDGGKSGAITPTTGPMWTEDTDFVGRVPIGAGLIPGTTTPAITTAVGDPTGGSEHTLTEAEGGVGVHTHGFGKYLNGAAGYNYTGLNTVPSYTGAVVQGISGSTTGSDTVSNMYTFPSGLTAAGVPTPTPFQVIQPSRAVYVIRRTQRQFYTVP